MNRSFHPSCAACCHVARSSRSESCERCATHERDVRIELGLLLAYERGLAETDDELSVKSIVSADRELPKPSEEDSTSGIHGFVRLPVPVLLMRCGSGHAGADARTAWLFAITSGLENRWCDAWNAACVKDAGLRIGAAADARHDAAPVRWCHSGPAGGASNCNSVVSDRGRAEPLRAIAIERSLPPTQGRGIARKTANFLIVLGAETHKLPRRRAQ